MIFVTVGSTDFDELIRAVDELCPSLGEDVVMQIGVGSYVPRNALAHFRYAPSLEGYYDRADLVISHGGLGTIMEVLRKGKRLVAASNPDRYDTHQEDLLGTLAAEGYLIWCRDLCQLAQDIRAARAMRPVPYIEPECRIHVIIQEYLARRRVGR